MRAKGLSMYKLELRFENIPEGQPNDSTDGPKALRNLSFGT